MRSSLRFRMMIRLLILGILCLNLASCITARPEAEFAKEVEQELKKIDKYSSSRDALDDIVHCLKLERSPKKLEGCIDGQGRIALAKINLKYFYANQDEVENNHVIFIRDHLNQSKFKLSPFSHRNKQLANYFEAIALYEEIARWSHAKHQAEIRYQAHLEDVRFKNLEMSQSLNNLSNTLDRIHTDQQINQLRNDLNRLPASHPLMVPMSNRSRY
jgi:predicted HTH domain antitoxin